MGIIAARPGCIRIRVSREMSFGPNTKPASREAESRAAAASSLASSTARAVSIITQTLIDGSALTAASRPAIAARSCAVETLGTRMPSGRAGADLAGHRGVIDPPRRIQRIEPDQHLALAEAARGEGL